MNAMNAEQKGLIIDYQSVLFSDLRKSALIGGQFSRASPSG
jgi:hypothetical protein